MQGKSVRQLLKRWGRVDVRVRALRRAILDGHRKDSQRLETGGEPWGEWGGEGDTW